MERDMISRGALAAYVDDLQAAGRLTFTREEAMLALGVTANALKQSVLRLAARRRVVSVRRGFYVVVPLEHRQAGIPPLDRWLQDLLRFHGASGEVMLVDEGRATVRADKRLRPVEVEGLVVTFQTT
jgi:hypothetical protein